MNKGYLLVPILLAIALGWMLYEGPSAVGPTQLPEEIADEPDLYMEGAKITQFETDGSLKYRLDADRIRHFASDQLTRMTEPHMQIHTPDQPPWLVTSRRGTMRIQAVGETVSEVVFLRDDVVMTQHFPDGRFMEIRAPSMYVYPDEQFAETHQTVMIDTASGRSLAAGLRANLALSKLQLRSGPDQRVDTLIMPDQMK